MLALALVLLAGCVAADDKVDLPVATSGFEAWTAVVAKAMSYGNKNQGESLKALQSFQSDVMAKMQKTVRSELLSASTALKHKTTFYHQEKVA